MIAVTVIGEHGSNLREVEMRSTDLLEDQALAARLRHETRTERMEQRVTRTVKVTVAFAAAMSGMATSEFVSRAAFEAALERLRSTRSARLAADDALRFCEALDRRREPNTAIRQLMAEHDEHVAES
jgi:uncharacterized protein (DUF1778 family)